MGYKTFSSVVIASCLVFGCGRKHGDRTSEAPPVENQDVPKSLALDLSFSASDVALQTFSYQGVCDESATDCDLQRITDAPLRLPATDGHLAVTVTVVQSTSTLDKIKFIQALWSCDGT